MKRERPGVLSVRSANQYRHRDILTYLGLRYYLHNTAACTDHWAKQVATDLVLTRTNLPYFRALHFKEITPDGTVGHRPIFLPCANETLAEAALLDECANLPHFSNPECVFSYDLNRGSDRSGIFQQYMVGVRARHDAIAKACDDHPAGRVLYTDIKAFYPSISTDLALKAWQRHSDLAGLAKRYRSLGEKIVNDYAAYGEQGHRGILTGPMFSHLLGNLVLRELDEECAEKLPAKYFRYVDDITLVGDRDAIAQSLDILHSRLDDLGLKLHEDASPKNFEVSAAEWLEGRDDFRESKRDISWPALIGDLKRFMLQHPEEREHLQQAFRNEGFRLPIHDYSGAIFESTWLERVCELAGNWWVRGKAQAVSIQSLLHQQPFPL